MSAAGTGMSMFGQLEQGKSDKRMAEFNARQQEAEAANVELESKEATRRGRRENERILGSQRAAAAKSGKPVGGHGRECGIVGNGCSGREKGGNYESEPITDRRTAYDCRREGSKKGFQDQSILNPS